MISVSRPACGTRRKSVVCQRSMICRINNEHVQCKHKCIHVHMVISQCRHKCTHTKSPQSVLTQMYTHTHTHTQSSQSVHTHTQHRVTTVSADTDINTHTAITDTGVQIHTVITVSAHTHTHTRTQYHHSQCRHKCTHIPMQSHTFSFPSDLCQPASFASFKTNPQNHVFVPKNPSAFTNDVPFAA